MSGLPLFDTSIDRALRTLPSRIQVALQALIDAPGDETDLHAAVDSHLQYLHNAFSRNEFLDLDLAERLAGRCHGLLRAVSNKDAKEPEHRLARAAVRYFIQDEDGDSDSDSILGLDDDAQVLRAAIVALGRDHLLEPTE